MTPLQVREKLVDRLALQIITYFIREHGVVADPETVNGIIESWLPVRYVEAAEEVARMRADLDRIAPQLPRILQESS